jgi:hypothetical protein
VGVVKVVAFPDGGGTPVDNNTFSELLQLVDGKRSDVRYFNSSTNAQDGVSP